MNFSVTGEPAPSQLDQKRKQLLSSLVRGVPGQSRLLAQGSGKGGFTRGYTANDSPLAAVPGLTFNPFVAQLQRGASGLASPTQAIRQQINDITGGAQPQAPFGTPGAQAPQPGGGPIPDAGPQGGVQAPAPAGGAPAPAGPVNAGGSPDMAYLMSGAGGDIFRNLFGYDPNQVAPPPSPTPIPYLRPRAGQVFAT